MAEQGEKYGVEWQADDDASQCPLCEKGFGMLTRKHHCRFCGLVVCSDCLKTKTEHYKTKEQESICDRCVPEWVTSEDVDPVAAEAAAAAAAATQAAREEKMVELFAKIDSNGNGELEVSELKSVFGDFAEQFLAHCDLDSDAKITPKEWVAGILQETKEMSDDDFQTEWASRMEECIANRTVEDPENRAATPNRTRPTGAAGEAGDEDDSSNLPIADLSEKYGVAWQNNEAFVACSQCETEFGILTRKHHCRFCGCVVCASCSPNNEEHPLSQTQERCCNQCFGVIEAQRVEDAGGLDQMSEKYGCTWQPDEESDKCKCCECEFGVFTRKHHCRFCGFVTCAGCTTLKTIHPKTTYNEAQCVTCTKKAKSEADAKAAANEAVRTKRQSQTMAM